ncbi:MAG: sulfatase [Myxococcota bacterium]
MGSLLFRATLVVLAVALGACGDDASDSPSVENEAERLVAEPVATPETVTVYDLAAHVGRAEIFQGPSRFVNFGVAGGAKYTLGGWRTFTGASRELDGTAGLVFPDVRGKVLLPLSGPSRVELRASALGDGRLTVYLDEETVHHATLPTDEFRTVAFTLGVDDDEAVSPGEHFLGFRVPEVGRRSGVRGGLVLDWIRVTPIEAVGEDAASPPPSVEGGTGLRLSRGVRLRYAHELFLGGRFQAELLEGALAVHRQCDGEARVRIGGANEAGPVDLEIGGVEGTLCALELEALTDVRLDAPRIAQPGPETQEGAASGEAPRPRNVLVYLIDTLRADKLRPYNANTRVRTPGLNRFVEAAAVLTRGQSQENWTKPSVATLLSGLYPWDHTATTGESVLPGSVVTLTETLREENFYTGAFVANGYVSHKFGFRQGWHTFRNYIREGRRTQASFIAADVLAWLDERPTDRPFFLYVHTIDPHVPYIPPNDILEIYDPEPYSGPVDFTEDRETLEKIKSGALRVNDRDRRRLEALYDGEITYHDTHMAAIFDGLRRRDLADNTMVVITSDHGEEFFDHDSVGHGHTVYQELLHVPLVVRVPGITERPVAVDDTVGLVDVVPTILDALAVDVPDEVSGRSFLPELRGERPDAPRFAVSGFMRGWRTIVVGRYKLIQRTERRTMIYDLTADPNEEHDLSEERPLTLRYLRGLLGMALAGELRVAEPSTPHPAETPHQAENTEIDAETEEQLRALGYVGTSRPQ